MKVIVFGGSGFIGSHVVDALTQDGYNVVVFDKNESMYLKKDQKMIIGDILDEDLVFKSIQDCEIVYNFAGIADIEKASQNPLDTIKFNIFGNSIILDACRRANVKRFIFASSIYVYSKAGSFYRSTKQSCELLVENYNEIFGLPYTILRYGSLYGPRADKSNFIYSIIKQALTKGKIIREGDGEEIREYIHVFDAAKSSVEILSNEFVNQHIMVTGSQQMKVKDLLLMIKEMLDNRIEVKYIPPKFNYHYEITPYSFSPKIGKRLTSKTYLDLGQGILDTISTIYKEINPLPVYDNILVKEQNSKRLRGKK